VRDTRDYERLLRERLYKIPGIRHSKSSFVLRTLKSSDTPLTFSGEAGPARGRATDRPESANRGGRSRAVTKAKTARRS
jgi:hypothetical protein